MIKDNYSKEAIDKLIIERGYIPIPYTCNKRDDSINFKDKDGYKYNIVYGNFIKSKNFKAITYSNKYSVENAKLYLINNKIPIELKSERINSVSEKLLFKMSCGHIEEIEWNKMKRRKSYMCVECYYKFEHSRDKELNEEYVRKEYKSNGLDWVNGERYLGVYSPIHCIDENKYEFSIRPCDISKRTGQQIVYNRNPYSINNIKRYLKIINSNTELISNEYIDSNKELMFKCECGNKFYRTWENVRCHESDKCLDCSVSHSKLEEKTRQLLDELKIKYKREYRFRDCVSENNIMLPFDFYLFEDKIVIECDGQGHFSPIRFNGIDIKKATKVYEKTIKNDSIKNDYCNKNGINIIRIKYDLFETNEYKNKILSALNLAD